ncbi:MAG: prepilin-type N-terminal cleavage/methylation domain-containing protein [Verrucomicrobiota bacterium]|jgi:prepilin-type N-terminal cleavage/methylation domain-containing protein
MNKRHAFTLIELLVVIAIIAIVAALVVNMNAGAQAAKKATQVNAGKFKLVLMIDNYQSKLNFYPPDNANLANPDNLSAPVYLANYDAWAATNPLIYELTGATNTTNGFIQAFDGTSNITSSIFSNVFGRVSVANSSIEEPHTFFKPGPQPKEYTNYSTNSASGLSNVWGLVVPVPLGPNINNFWHYDSSSTNRHNLNGYDLWAEYLVGNKNGYNVILTNGNW